MQQFSHIVASLVFTVHALLGCGVHHTCSHELAMAGATLADSAGHHCHDAVPPGSPAPLNGETGSGHVCNDEACTFMKAELVQVDIADGNGEWLTVVAPPGDGRQPPTSRIAGDLSNAANSSATQLYVWHCALLI